MCSNLKKQDYSDSDTDQLKVDLECKINEIKNSLEQFFKQQQPVKNSLQSWGNSDYVYELIQKIQNDNPSLPSLSQSDLYEICDEGKERYRKSIPPGFEDNDKDGIRKYSDLIVWKEIINYAKNKGRNIIFVTNDNKSDWWSQHESHHIFHPDLTREFSDKTTQIITALNSTDFLKFLSESYEIDKSDEAEFTLEFSIENYIEQISDDVFEKISTELISDNEEDQSEINDWHFISADPVDFDEDEATYLLKYNIIIEGQSFVYSGRDEDSKEAVMMPEYLYTKKGEIIIEIRGTIENLLNYKSSSDLNNIEIVENNLEITELKYANFDEDYRGAEFSCGRCGNEIKVNTNHNAGFYEKCANEII